MQIFQLFEPSSSTYTYLLVDEATRDAVLIDPVDTMLQRDLEAISAAKARLRYVLETHAHADHITSTAQLIEHTGALSAVPAGCGIETAAIQLQDGQTLEFGGEVLRAIHTPGHTYGSMCFLVNDQLFSGDTLLIGGCGRTDFQSGSAADLFDSITKRLFVLPADTVVWPAHDYRGKTSTTIATEQLSNTRLTENGSLRSKSDFIALMDSLNLPKPKRIDEAVPANQSLGLRHDAGGQTEDARQQVQTPPQGGYAGDIYPELAWVWHQAGQGVLVDIRSDAERAWVGFVPNIPGFDWKHWPSGEINAQFDEKLRATVPAGQKVMFLCRSGIRSINSAKRAQALGYEAYNILEGFEGDPDEHGHRNRRGGWRFRGLPWRQN